MVRNFQIHKLLVSPNKTSNKEPHQPKLITNSQLQQLQILLSHLMFKQKQILDLTKILLEWIQISFYKKERINKLITKASSSSIALMRER